MVEIRGALRRGLSRAKTSISEKMEEHRQVMEQRKAKKEQYQQIYKDELDKQMQFAIRRGARTVARSRVRAKIQPGKPKMQRAAELGDFLVGFTPEKQQKMMGKKVSVDPVWGPWGKPTKTVYPKQRVIKKYRMPSAKKKRKKGKTITIRLT